MGMKKAIAFKTLYDKKRVQDKWKIKTPKRIRCKLDSKKYS